MWSLQKRPDNTFYLTYDRSRFYRGNSRGIWELIGAQGVFATERAKAVNEAMGYICAPDDEGNVRVLVLT